MPHALQREGFLLSMLTFAFVKLQWFLRWSPHSWDSRKHLFAKSSSIFNPFNRALKSQVPVTVCFLNRPMQILCLIKRVTNVKGAWHCQHESFVFCNHLINDLSAACPENIALPNQAAPIVHDVFQQFKCDPLWLPTIQDLATKYSQGLFVGWMSPEITIGCGWKAL